MSANSTTQATVSYADLLRNNRNFRFLWFGQIASLLGDWFNLVASAALVGLLTQSGLAVGSLFVVRMLAPFLVSPIAGVVADRYKPQTHSHRGRPGPGGCRPRLSARARCRRRLAALHPDRAAVCSERILLSRP